MSSQADHNYQRFVQMWEDIAASATPERIARATAVPRHAGIVAHGAIGRRILAAILAERTYPVGQTVLDRQTALSQKERTAAAAARNDAMRDAHGIPRKVRPSDPTGTADYWHSVGRGLIDDGPASLAPSGTD